MPFEIICRRRPVHDGKDVGYMDLVLSFDGIVTRLELSEKIAVTGIGYHGGWIKTEAFKEIMGHADELRGAVIVQGDVVLKNIWAQPHNDVTYLDLDSSSAGLAFVSSQ